MGRCVSPWADQAQVAPLSSRRSQAKHMVSTSPQTRICNIKASPLPSCTPISVARSFTTLKRMFIFHTLQWEIHSSLHRMLERLIIVFHPSPDRCTQLTCATSSSPCSVSRTLSTLKSATTSSGACLGGRGSG